MIIIIYPVWWDFIIFNYKGSEGEQRVHIISGI